jgi:hypothetical protein
MTPGTINATTGAYNTVDISFQVQAVPSGRDVNYVVNLGSLLPESGEITGTGGTQSITQRFTNVPFGVSINYIIQVDDSPSAGAVTESIPSTPGNEDINRFDGTVTLAAPNPTITVTLPEFVRSGETATVGVTVSAVYSTTCQLFGPGFSAPSSQFTVTAGVTANITRSTAALTNATNVAVRCLVPGGPDFSVSDSVEVTPAFQEV